MHFIPRKKLLAVGLLLGLSAFNAEASLTAYTAAGNQSVVYSSVSNATWTADANLLGTLEASNSNLINTIISNIGSISDSLGIHILSTTDFGANGLIDWWGAQAYIKYLNAINYAGSNQWALPSAGVNPQLGFSQTGTQFGQLFYSELGSKGGGAIPNTSNFTNEQAFYFWLGSEFSPNPYNAWDFSTLNGIQDFSLKNAKF